VHGGNEVDMSFNDEEMEIAIYGLKRLGMFAASLMVAFVIGMLMDNVKGVFLFLLFFIPLRIFAGGLHMPKLWICAITSSLLLVGVAFVFNNVNDTWIYEKTYLAIIFAGAVVIMFLAPVDTANKPLFKEEKVRFKIISIIITIIEMAIFQFSRDNSFVKILIFMVITIEAFYLAVQKIVNYISEKRSESEQ